MNIESPIGKRLYKVSSNRRYLSSVYLGKIKNIECDENNIYTITTDKNRQINLEKSRLNILSFTYSVDITVMNGSPLHWTKLYIRDGYDRSSD